MGFFGRGDRFLDVDGRRLRPSRCRARRRPVLTRRLRRAGLGEPMAGHRQHQRRRRGDRQDRRQRRPAVSGEGSPDPSDGAVQPQEGQGVEREQHQRGCEQPGRKIDGIRAAEAAGFDRHAEIQGGQRRKRRSRRQEIMRDVALFAAVEARRVFDRHRFGAAGKDLQGLRLGRRADQPALAVEQSVGRQAVGRGLSLRGAGAGPRQRRDAPQHVDEGA